MSDPAPPGFVTRRGPTGTLIVDATRGRELEEAGLGRIGGWTERLGPRRSGAGRGATARLGLPGGPLRVKQLRRGGWIASAWRDRFPGSARPLSNLRVPLSAVQRGVATPAPVALFLVDGPGPLCRAWLAVEEIERATDLAARFACAPPPTRTELNEVMRQVRRMHEAGVEHRDLNLGNLLLRTEPGAEPRGWVLDLDRARLHAKPLPFPLRQRALRRLERSHLKLFGDSPGSDGSPRDLFYELYAAGDDELSRRLELGRGTGRFLLRVQRTGRY